MKVTRVVAPVRQQAVEVIRNEILDGRFLPGQRLIERELCEELDISRTTLREAYRQLEAEGFIHIAPHKGPTVAILDDAEALAVFEVREVLECFAIKLFVQRATADEVGRLHAVVARLREAHESGDVSRMLDVKREFYDVVYAGARNSILRSQAALLASRLYRLRARSLSSPGRPAASIAEIENVVDSIDAGDSAGAAALWSVHIHNAAVAAVPGAGDS